MKILLPNFGKKGMGGVIGTATSVIVILIVVVIISAVVNNITFTSTISNTIKPFLEPVALLAAFVVVASLAYKATRR